MTNYDYDLVTSKINTVVYQPGKGDQFIYKYSYDADNRIMRVYTSRDNLFWNEEASYTYYLHGPLARAELGQLKVQGVDYAYTVQGWLKGINGDMLSSSNEIGQDGQTNTIFSRGSTDVYALQIGYFNNDYKAIGNDAGAFTHRNYEAPTSLAVSGNQLFNGNINYSTMSLSKINNGSTAGNSYGYDQLNRLVHMRYHTTNGAWNNNNIVDAYSESIAYDGNGNILKYLRKGADASNMPLDMDSLTYHYNHNINGKLVNNRINFVTDSVNGLNYSMDIDNQLNNNYRYDITGNLVKDKAEGLDTVLWNAYGKIKQIKKDASYLTLNFGYNASGHRTMKQVITHDTTSNTYYVRDPEGNVIAVYLSSTLYAGTKWVEQHLYGSRRIGMWQWDTVVPFLPPVVLNDNPIFDSVFYGRRAYELTNQLGNVVAVISDKKNGFKLTSSSSVDFYNAEVLTQCDYYPFGMLMAGRQFKRGGNYRFGFNGKESDDEVKGIDNQQDYGMRIYDTRLGRFLSVDPVKDEYPQLSPYQFASNRPIDGVDLDGKEYLTIKVDIVVSSSGELIMNSSIEEDFRQKSEEEMNKLHKTKDFYKQYSAGFGSKGRGVLYKYTVVYEGQDLVENFDMLFDRGHFYTHGIYAGPGTSTKYGPIIEDNATRNPYLFNIRPNDEVDDLSRTHDLRYDEVPEYRGWLDDTRTIDADIQFVKGLQHYLRNATKKGYRDNFTGRPPSEEAIKFAKKAITLFTSVIAYKVSRRVNELSGNIKPAPAINTDDKAQRDIDRLRIPRVQLRKMMQDYIRAQEKLKRNAVQDKR